MKDLTYAKIALISSTAGTGCLVDVSGLCHVGHYFSSVFDGQIAAKELAGFVCLLRVAGGCCHRFRALGSIRPPAIGGVRTRGAHAGSDWSEAGVESELGCCRNGLAAHFIVFILCGLRIGALLCCPGLVAIF